MCLQAHRTRVECRFDDDLFLRYCWASASSNSLCPRGSWTTTGQYGPPWSAQSDIRPQENYIWPYHLQCHLVESLIVSQGLMSAGNLNVSFGVLMLACTRYMSLITGSLPEHKP